MPPNATRTPPDASRQSFPQANGSLRVIQGVIQANMQRTGGVIRVIQVVIQVNIQGVGWLGSCRAMLRSPEISSICDRSCLFLLQALCALPLGSQSELWEERALKPVRTTETTMTTRASQPGRPRGPSEEPTTSAEGSPPGRVPLPPKLGVTRTLCYLW